MDFKANGKRRIHELNAKIQMCIDNLRSLSGVDVTRITSPEGLVWGPKNR